MKVSAAEIGRLRPAEVLVSEDSTLCRELSAVRGLSRRPPWHFDAERAGRTLAGHFGVADLSAFGCEDLPAALGAAGCLFQYAAETQRTALRHVQGLEIERQKDSVLLDAASRRNLEIDTALSGARDHSLIGLMDTAVTAMGGRWLRRWVHRPIRDRHHLGLRHHAVGALLAGRHYEGIRECLRPIGDLERVLARIALRTARPRDLAQLRTSLGALPELHTRFEGVDSPRLHDLRDAIGCFPLLYARLAAGLSEHPPPLLREGGVIASGFDADLDALRRLSEDAGQVLAEIEARERQRTGVASLKIGHHRVHGYYLELGRSHDARVPADYRRRQTLKGTERYVTDELCALEERILRSGERALARERVLYEGLIDEVLCELPALQASAAAVAELGCAGRLRGARGDPGPVPAGAGRGARDHHRGRPASRGGAGPGDGLRAERSPPRRGATHAHHHRAQYGRQIDLYAPDGAHRAARLQRQLRAGAARGAGALSIGSSPASAPPTTSRPGARPSWSR